MAKVTEAQIKITAKNDTKSAFSSVSKGIKGLNTDVSKFAGVIGGVALAGVAGLGAALFDMAKGAAEAQVSAAKVTATLDSMVGTTMEVATGLTKTVTAMKLTGQESAEVSNAIQGTKIALKEKAEALRELKKRYNDDKISSAQYKLAQEKIANQVDALNLKLAKYNGAVGDVETSTVALTRSVTVTAEQIAVVRKQIEEASLATVRLGFDDEAAAESLAKLYQRTGDFAKALQLNNIAMDLARAKNMDLLSASNAVGLVMSGNTKILKQFGIEIDESLTPLEMLGQLQDKVAGQALGFSTTFTGQMLILSETFSNFKDTIGAVLLEAVMPFIVQLGTWASDPAVVNKVKEIATVLSDLAIVVIPLVVGALKIMVSALSIILSIMDKIGQSIIYVINKVWDLVDAIKALSKQEGGFGMNASKSLASKAISGISNLLSFDTGGVVPGPTGAAQLAMVHGGETILPTHKSGNFGGGTTVNIINPTLLDNNMINALSQHIARALGRETRY